MKDNATWDDFDGIPESEADVTSQGSKQERIIAEDEFYKVSISQYPIKKDFFWKISALQPSLTVVFS